MKNAVKEQKRSTAMRWADVLFRLYGEERDYADKTKGNTWAVASDGSTAQSLNLLDVEFNPAKWPVVSADLLLPDVRNQAEGDYFHVDDGREPAVWPISVAWVVETEDGNAQFFSAKTVTTAYARSKRARLFGRHMARMDSIGFDAGGRVFKSGSAIAFRASGGRWVDAFGPGNAMESRGQGQALIHYSPAIAIGYALRLRYEWLVIFHFSSGLRLSFSAGPSDIIALLSDRDRPLDGGRRAALLHWVEKHWRTYKSGVSSEVIKHLRGVGKVEWRGHSIEIIPPQFDVEAA